MLTEHERQWLEKRKPGDWCVTHDCSAFFEGECISVTCYMDISWLYREAAEFEAKVAAKLALGCESQTPCNGCWRANWKLCNLRKGYWDCADCFLKVARLKVEEEMDG